MNLQSDDFELFGLKPQFVQDRSLLHTRWTALQQEAHPDKFADQGAAAQRLALQWSVRINEAYQRLKNPVMRAAYVCELAGVPVNAQTNTAMPAHFLMQQMDWRETLEAAHSPEQLDTLRTTVERFRADSLLQCESLLDQRKDPQAAVEVVRGLMFMEKFSLDLERAYERFD